LGQARKTMQRDRPSRFYRAVNSESVDIYLFENRGNLRKITQDPEKFNFSSESSAIPLLKVGKPASITVKLVTDRDRLDSCFTKPKPLR
jgi:hypothetical protein